MRLSTTRVLATLALLVAAPCAAAPDADVAAAARAFEEGQRAQLRGEYAAAAELFELADRTVPSAPALRSAIRNCEAAGNAARALTLALRAADRYPGDADTRRLVEGVLARLGPALARLVARCQPECTLAVDGRVVTAALLARHEVYLPPGEHQLEARAEDGRRDGRVLRVAAGDSEQLTLHPTALVATADASATATATETKRDRRLPPVWVVAGATATATLAAVLIWSGVDTLQARDRYAHDPTESGYRDGLGREARTNGLLAATVVLGAATAGVALFGTRWRGPFARRRSPD